MKTNALFFFRKRKGFSLRLGHRSALTAIQAVIHSLAAASLRKRKIPLSTRPMRASVVFDSRFTQIRAKVCSPSDIRRCIPIPDVQATALAARLFWSAFGAKRLCGDVDRSTLTGKKAPHVRALCSHKAFFERRRRELK